MPQVSRTPTVKTLLAHQRSLSSQIRPNTSSIRPPTTVMTSQTAPTANMTSQMKSNQLRHPTPHNYLNSSRDVMPNMRSVIYSSSRECIKCSFLIKLSYYI